MHQLKKVKKKIGKGRVTKNGLDHYACHKKCIIFLMVRSALIFESTLCNYISFGEAKRILFFF